MIVLINGSRDFSDYCLLERKCYEILSPYIKRGIEIIIREGNARGADKLAERFAKEYGFKLEIFSANWKLYGKKAGFLRNIQMVEGDKENKPADILISFNMGTSGTTHTIKYMRSKYPNKSIFEIKC